MSVWMILVFGAIFFKSICASDVLAQVDDELFRLEQLILCDEKLKKEAISVLSEYPEEFFQAVEWCMDEIVPGLSKRAEKHVEYYCTPQKYVYPKDLSSTTFYLLKHPLEFSMCLNRTMLKYGKFLTEEEKTAIVDAQKKGSELWEKIILSDEYKKY